jgi:hypothetical protein
VLFVKKYFTEIFFRKGAAPSPGGFADLLQR